MLDRSATRGFAEVITFGKITTNKTMTNRVAENQNIQLLRSDFQACFHWLSGGCEVSTWLIEGPSASTAGATQCSCPWRGEFLCIANPRIYSGIQQINNQAGNNIDKYHDGYY